MSTIPSDEDFAKAKFRMKERDKNMRQVNEALRDYFRRICPSKAFDSYIIAEDFSRFRAYIFFKRNEDIHECEESGISSQVQKFVYDELERQERGSKESVVVAFEFDSDENVQVNFEGDYFLRMR
ncbi:MAG: hypothetical protein U0998_00010 [Moraxellaceae bacterium]|nr:hypothetical protein [Moraxellaceae bacterium]MDZ4385587.1 hypothetical protein [Moraxellaceae bacterium]